MLYQVSCHAYDYLIQELDGCTPRRVLVEGIVEYADSSAEAREWALQCLPPGYTAKDVAVYVRPWNQKSPKGNPEGESHD